MTYEDFVSRFQRDFAPAIEVQQLASKFQDLRQTIETVTEITSKIMDRALLFSQCVANE